MGIRGKTENSSVPLDNPHPGVVCDQCDVSINGIRFKCTVCPNYDLCSTCEAKNIHPVDHNMLSIKKPAPVRVACGPWFVGGNRCGFKPKHKCGGSKKSVSSKSSETFGKSDQPCASHMNEVVQELATMFGFDADVATSQMQSLFQQMCPEKSAAQEKNEAAATADKASEKKEDSASGSAATPNTAASEDATKPDSDAPKPSSPNNHAENLHPLFSQFGGIQNGQFENMGKMMETFMQSFGSHGATNGADRSNEEKKRETEGFVVVDEKEKKHDKSEEETFQQR